MDGRRAGANALAVILLGAAGLYLALGADKGLGIFAVILAALAARYLVLHVAEEEAGSAADPAEPGPQSADPPESPLPPGR